ncbi:hypothetical protein QJQ45_006162 [Haematococcus lacustris]|nr:hypothetical protein QJQ45_006162 [Haematococcus lacustris]
MQSTYCDTLYQHCQAIGRTIHIVNLDPAAEHFAYPVSLDVRDLVTLEDVMEEMELGPNGGLLYCMEYLEDNLHEWLGEELQSWQGYGDDDYLMFDCPGQIELYSHLSIFKTFVDFLRNDGWSVCAVYCLDAHFVTDVSKFIAGALQAEIEDFLFPEPRLLLDRLSTTTGPRFAALNSAVGALLDEFSLVSFVPLDVTDEDSIAEVLYNIDTAIQYGEDAEVKVREQEGIEGMEGEAEAALS